MLLAVQVPRWFQDSEKQRKDVYFFLLYMPFFCIPLPQATGTGLQDFLKGGEGMRGFTGRLRLREDFRQIHTVNSDYGQMVQVWGVSVLHDVLALLTSE